MKKTKQKETIRTLDEVLEEKHQKKMRKIDKLKSQRKLDEKHAKNLSHLDEFIMLERDDIVKFFEISGPLALYMYLRLSINRASREGTWMNLDKYFREGLLVTCRTKSYVAKEMGESIQNISNWFSRLEELGYIVQVGTETMKIGESYQAVPVYALGEVKIKDNYSYELFYYEQF